MFCGPGSQILESEAPKGFVKTQIPGPHHQFLIQYIWDLHF